MCKIVLSIYFFLDTYNQLLFFKFYLSFVCFYASGEEVNNNVIEIISNTQNNEQANLLDDGILEINLQDIPIITSPELLETLDVIQIDVKDQDGKAF